MSPGLEKVALCKRCPVGPSGHQNEVLQRCSLCGLVWPLVVAGPQLLQTHWQARLVPGLAGCEVWQQLLWEHWCAG